MGGVQGVDLAAGVALAEVRAGARPARPGVRGAVDLASGPVHHRGIPRLELDRREPSEPYRRVRHIRHVVTAVLGAATGPVLRAGEHDLLVLRVNGVLDPVASVVAVPGSLRWRKRLPRLGLESPRPNRALVLEAAADPARVRLADVEREELAPGHVLAEHPGVVGPVLVGAVHAAVVPAVDATRHARVPRHGVLVHVLSRVRDERHCTVDGLVQHQPREEDVGGVRRVNPHAREPPSVHALGGAQARRSRGNDPVRSAVDRREEGLIRAHLVVGVDGVCPAGILRIEGDADAADVVCRRRKSRRRAETGERGATIRRSPDARALTRVVADVRQTDVVPHRDQDVVRVLRVDRHIGGPRGLVGRGEDPGPCLPTIACLVEASFSSGGEQVAGDRHPHVVRVPRIDDDPSDRARP